MKKLLYIFSILLFNSSFSQRIEVKETSNFEEVDLETKEENCFLYKRETSKGNLVKVREFLLNYGWNNDMARITITEYNYKAGDTTKFWAKSKIHYVNGRFQIKKNIFTFTPNKKENVRRIFTIHKKNKRTVLFEDTGNKFTKIVCPLPEPLGM